MEHLNPVDLIVAKRDGSAHDPDELKAFVHAYTRGDIPDYQVSSWLMAAFLNGLNYAETAALTHAMLYSGEVLDLSDIPGVKVDKHSTGGVGDKISLILAPIVAACGVPVPMISGRGLGHTGGTLDKLESFPGFRTDLTIDQYREQLEEIGIVMIGQTDEIAPADRKLYALRDVTGTVEFIPFIAASIMSKKLAEGIDALVLDVKCGSGAFMKEEREARKLAETLVGIGSEFDKPTAAWLTDMSVPLGYGIGNWPETEEAIRCLKGEDVTDVMEVTYALAADMLRMGGAASTLEAGLKMAREAVTSGSALEKLRELVKKQGGDVRYIDNPSARQGAKKRTDIIAPDDARGYVGSIDAFAVGRLAVRLGAGRNRKEDDVDPVAGITLNKKQGDPVEPGEILAWLHTSKEESIAAFRSELQRAYRFSEQPVEETSRLLDRYLDGEWRGISIGRIRA